jgi:hypothetical protein
VDVLDAPVHADEMRCCSRPPAVTSTRRSTCAAVAELSQQQAAAERGAADDQRPGVTAPDGGGLTGRRSVGSCLPHVCVCALWLVSVFFVCALPLRRPLRRLPLQSASSASDPAARGAQTSGWAGQRFLQRATAVDVDGWYLCARSSCCPFRFLASESSSSSLQQRDHAADQKALAKSEARSTKQECRMIVH